MTVNQRLALAACVLLGVLMVSVFVYHRQTFKIEIELANHIGGTILCAGDRVDVVTTSNGKTETIVKGAMVEAYENANGIGSVMLRVNGWQGFLLRQAQKRGKLFVAVNESNRAARFGF